MSTTLDHYNQTADRYVQNTAALDSVSPDRDAFVAQVLTRGPAQEQRLLDAGSGSGRDTVAFQRLGFAVDAFDGSAELAKRSTELTGVATRVMTFEQLDLPANTYDGIWAMASLLHVAREDLPGVLVDLAQSLKPGGVFFASFKYGTETRTDANDGRRFTDLDEAGVAALTAQMEGLTVKGTTQVISGDTTAKGRAPWFSVVWERNELEPRLIEEAAPSPRRPKP